MQARDEESRVCALYVRFKRQVMRAPLRCGASLRPVASHFSILTCITTQWQPAMPWCKFMAPRPYSLTTSIPRMTRARSKKHFAADCADERGQEKSSREFCESTRIT